MNGQGESDFGNMYHFLYVVQGSEMAKRILLDQCFYEVTGSRPRKAKDDLVLMNRIKGQLDKK